MLAKRDRDCVICIVSFFSAYTEQFRPVENGSNFICICYHFDICRI